MKFKLRTAVLGKRLWQLDLAIQWTKQWKNSSTTKHNSWKCGQDSWSLLHITNITLFTVTVNSCLNSNHLSSSSSRAHRSSLALTLHRFGILRVNSHKPSASFRKFSENIHVQTTSATYLFVSTCLKTRLHMHVRRLLWTFSQNPDPARFCFSICVSFLFSTVSGALSLYSCIRYPSTELRFFGSDRPSLSPMSTPFQPMNCHWFVLWKATAICFPVSSVESTCIVAHHAHHRFHRCLPQSS